LANLISRATSSTRWKFVLRPTMSRQAAAMQNRLDPASFARRAAAIMSSVLSIFWACTAVWYREDCGQYLQSSEHPPILMFKSVHCCTARTSWCLRCITAYPGNHGGKEKYTHTLLSTNDRVVVVCLLWKFKRIHNVPRNRASPSEANQTHSGSLRASS